MNNQNLSLPIKEKIALFDNLSTMLGAGISILETFDSLLEDSKGNQKKILLHVRKDLTQGKQLSGSFANFPEVFDKVTLNILRAAEEAGTLDVTLKDIKKHIQKEMEFSDKVTSAMIYPAFIFVVFIGIMILILTFVMPKMASVFLRMRVQLPLPTKILIAISSFIMTNTIQILIAIFIVIVIFIFIYKTKKSFILNIFLSLPLISGLAKKIDIARFTRSMSLLLSSGLPLTNSLKLSQEVVFRKDMRKLIIHIQTAVMSGKEISDAVRDAKGFIPIIVIKLIEAGEKTGSLDDAMQNISQHMDYEVERTLSALLALLEPVMLVFIGIAVGGMMLSIIAPIYQIIGQIRGM